MSNFIFKLSFDLLSLGCNLTVPVRNKTVHVLLIAHAVKRS